MKYLIMIQINPTAKQMWDSLSADEQAAGYEAHGVVREAMAASGELLAAEALADVSLSKRITVKDGTVMTTDGPFAEVKEYLAGFYLVECENIDRAIEHAARLPEAGLGLIEVRPVLDLT